MAVLLVYQKSTHLSNRYTEFPRDFTVCGEAVIDDCFDGEQRIHGRMWRLNKPSGNRWAYVISTRIIGQRIKGPPQTVLLHRLIWELVNGELPHDLDIDHINQDVLDNRLSNLRLVDSGQNAWNSRKFVKATRYPYKGVDLKLTSSGRERYQAYTAVKRRKIFLGCFDTCDEAAVAVNVSCDLLRDSVAYRNTIPEGSVSDQEKEKIRLSVTKKLCDRGLISSAELSPSLSI